MKPHPPATTPSDTSIRAKSTMIHTNGLQCILFNRWLDSCRARAQHQEQLRAIAPFPTTQECKSFTCSYNIDIYNNEVAVKQMSLESSHWDRRAFCAMQARKDVERFETKIRKRGETIQVGRRLAAIGVCCCKRAAHLSALAWQDSIQGQDVISDARPVQG
jgi:hypothetical protein